MTLRAVSSSQSATSRDPNNDALGADSGQTYLIQRARSLSTLDEDQWRGCEAIGPR
jgi:hypothetical protein